MREGKIQFTSAGLHILAMALMLCDHTWATLLPGWDWLTCIGRIAFPIFAFMIAEGFFKTHDRNKYIKRMIFFAVVSEIPFNFMYAGTWRYPYHQNVLWTFAIALLLMQLLEWVKAKNNRILFIFVSILVVLLGFIVGLATFVDYYGFGILTVLVFYFFNRKNLICFIGQLVCLYIINVEGLGGMYYPVNILGLELEIVQQGLALFALIPIWLYRGEKGYNRPWFKTFCYCFYPAHMLLLHFILALSVR